MFISEELVGKKIMQVRNLTEEESDGLYFGATAVIQLDDGTLIYPQSDDEGNGFGTLVCQTPKDEFKYIYVSSKS